jgi:hypothetical protein
MTQSLREAFDQVSSADDDTIETALTEFKAAFERTDQFRIPDYATLGRFADWFQSLDEDRLPPAIVLKVAEISQLIQKRF